MRIVVISDGEDSSGTFNLVGIKNKSKNEILIKQFDASDEEIDWADLVYVHYGGIGTWKDLQQTLRKRQDKPWVIGIRGHGTIKRCFIGRKELTPVSYVEKYFKAYSVSNKEIYELVNKWGGKPTYLCQAGVDTDRFAPSKPPTQFCMGWVGNPWAGSKAFHRFQDFPFPLRIAGATRQYLKVKVNPDNFNLVNEGGFIQHEDIHKFYQDISVYVSVSDNEGCPMPPLEAASSGRVVVATKTGALMEWVPPEYLVDKDKYKELIPIIEKLRDNLTLYNKECIRFRKISLNWDFSVIAKQYDSMFLEVCEQWCRK